MDPHAELSSIELKAKSLQVSFKDIPFESSNSRVVHFCKAYEGYEFEEDAWQSEHFENERQREIRERQILIPEVSGEKCPKCSSAKVKTELQQIRSADEGMTLIKRCIVCNFQILKC